MMLENMTQACMDIGVSYDGLDLGCDFGCATATGLDGKGFLMCHVGFNRLLNT